MWLSRAGKSVSSAKAETSFLRALEKINQSKLTAKESGHVASRKKANAVEQGPNKVTTKSNTEVRSLPKVRILRDPGIDGKGARRVLSRSWRIFSKECQLRSEFYVATCELFFLGRMPAQVMHDIGFAKEREEGDQQAYRFK